MLPQNHFHLRGGSTWRGLCNGLSHAVRGSMISQVRVIGVRRGGVSDRAQVPEESASGNTAAKHDCVSVGFNVPGMYVIY